MVSGVSFVRFYFNVFRLGASTCLQLDPNGDVRASKLSVVAVVPVLAIFAYNSYDVASNSLTLERTQTFLSILAVIPPIILCVLCTFGQLMNLRPFSEAMKALAICDTHLKLPRSILFYPVCEFLAISVQNALTVYVAYAAVRSRPPTLEEIDRMESFKTFERDESEIEWETFKATVPLLLQWSFIFSSSMQYCCLVNTIGQFFYQVRLGQGVFL